MVLKDEGKDCTKDPNNPEILCQQNVKTSENTERWILVEVKELSSEKKQPNIVLKIQVQT